MVTEGCVAESDCVIWKCPQTKVAFLIESVSFALLSITYTTVHHTLFSLQDGRLLPGDQLVQVNGENVQGVPHNEVVEKLHTISRSGQPLAMIVARARPSPSSLPHQRQPQQRKHSVQKEAETDGKEAEESVVDSTGSVADEEPDSSEEEGDTETVS